MIPAPKKAETEKKVFNLPDDLMQTIDEFGIGEYVSRSDFLTSAIRNYLRDIQRHRNEMEERIFRKNGNIAEAIERSYEKIFDYMAGQKKCLSRYNSKEHTSITLYLPKMLIMHTNFFIDKQGPVRNFQEFARIACILELDEMERLCDGYVDI